MDGIKKKIAQLRGELDESKEKEAALDRKNREKEDKISDVNQRQYLMYESRIYLKTVF